MSETPQTPPTDPISAQSDAPSTRSRRFAWVPRRPIGRVGHLALAAVATAVATAVIFGAGVVLGSSIGGSDAERHHRDGRESGEYRETERHHRDGRERDYGIERDGDSERGIDDGPSRDDDSTDRRGDQPNSGETRSGRGEATPSPVVPAGPVAPTSAGAPTPGRP